MAKEKEIDFKKLKVSHRDKLSTEDLITLTLSENIDAYALLLYKKNQELEDKISDERNIKEYQDPFKGV